MSFTSFRNSFLTEAESRLDAINTTTATNTDLLVSGALYKMAAAVAEVDLLGPSALRLLETMTGTQLEAWLQDLTNRDAFERVLSSSEAMRAVAASSTAMTAVAASSTAMTAVAASSTAMTAVIANSSAWAAVVASSTAMTAVAASSTAMTAVAASSTAMTAINASDTALNALYASPLVVKYTHAGNAWSANPQILRNGAGLFVRLTQLDNSSGWSDNYTSSRYLRFDGSNVTIASTNNGLPYNFTQVNAKFGRQIARRFNSEFGFYDYNRIELAWIPL